MLTLPDFERAQDAALAVIETFWEWNGLVREPTPEGVDRLIETLGARHIQLQLAMRLDVESRLSTMPQPFRFYTFGVLSSPSAHGLAREIGLCLLSVLHLAKSDPEHACGILRALRIRFETSRIVELRAQVQGEFFCATEGLSQLCLVSKNPFAAPVPENPVPAKTAKPKRARKVPTKTKPGPPSTSRPAIVGFLRAHHRIDSRDAGEAVKVDRDTQNFTPATVTGIAGALRIPKSVVSAFFKDASKGHKKYEDLCGNPEAFVKWLANLDSTMTPDEAARLALLGDNEKLRRAAESLVAADDSAPEELEGSSRSIVRSRQL